MHGMRAIAFIALAALLTADGQLAGLNGMSQLWRRRLGSTGLAQV